MQEQTGKSHSHPSHCKPSLACRKGVGRRKKLKTNMSMEKKINLFDGWKKIQSSSNAAN